MLKLLQNLKKYYKYASYQAKSELKSEIASSHLSWLWWILDPLCNMMVYVFIVQVVFTSNEAYFPVFVFLGLTTWELFNRNISSSIKTVKNNIGTINKVYVPKYIFLVSKGMVFLFKYFISFGVVVLLMMAFRLPFTWVQLNFILILLILNLVCFGIGTIFLHFGVFVEDLSNIVTIVLKLLFYLSGIFYSIPERLPNVYGDILLYLNPVAFIIQQFRNIFIYGVLPDYVALGAWFVVAVILNIIGISLIHRSESSYAKVV